MNITNLFVLCGGLAFFLYGMHVMSSGLEKVAGSKLEGMLKKMTSNPVKSLLLGMGITIAIQSSSAMTVMLVGLVNSGIMQLGQTIGVIMGSNIGTTLTAWILSLSGIEAEPNSLINLLKPENFSPVLALIGVIFILGKKTSRKNIGSILVGFAVLMSGMDFMKNAVAPITEIPQFQNLLVMFTNPILGVIVGAIFTGIIQSSAASVGILQAFAQTGSITYGMAIPIILGQNIGTCVTALLSSIGVNKNAKRVAVVHILFNVLGSTIFLVIFYGLGLVVDFGFLDNKIDMTGIALVHSIFNIASTIILLPASKLLEKAAMAIIKDKAEDSEKYAFIDERLLATPSVAINECFSITVDMAQKARTAIIDVIGMLTHYDEKTADKILALEDEIDIYEDRLGTVLVKISNRSLSYKDSHRVSTLLHTIGDFERISDHAVNLLGVAREINEKNIHFSDEAKKELSVLTSALVEILDNTVTAFAHDDLKSASLVEPLEQVIDRLIAKVKSNHVTRLKNGNCTIELGFVLADLLTNYERVSDHCSNIAVAMIEVEKNKFNTHEYLSGIKNDGDKDFEEAFGRFAAKYSID